MGGAASLLGFLSSPMRAMAPGEHFGWPWYLSLWSMLLRLRSAAIWAILVGLLGSVASVIAGLLAQNSKAYFAGIVGLIVGVGTFITLKELERKKDPTDDSQDSATTANWARWGRWLVVPGVVILILGLLSAMYYPYYTITGQEGSTPAWVACVYLIGFIGSVVSLGLYFNVPRLAISTDTRLAFIGVVGVLVGALALFAAVVGVLTSSLTG